MNEVYEAIQPKVLNNDAKKTLLRKLLQKRKPTEHTSSMSKGQESLWYVHQNAPRGSAYNVASAMRVYSHLSKGNLEKAMNFCIARHPILRTRYVIQKGEARQVTQAVMKVKLSVVDASPLKEAELNRLINRDYHQAFHLSASPLLRLYVYELGKNDSIIMLVVHHIIFDAHSLWILMEELGAIYQALVNREPVTLRSKTESYEVFIQKQNGLLKSRRGQELQAYWLEKLKGDHYPLTLDISKRRPKIQSYNGESFYFELSKELSASIRQFSMAQGVTINTVLLSAYYCLLYRHSGQKDLCVISPTAGRNDPSFSRTIGYFVNPVVLRARLSGEMCFSELLKQVHLSVLEGITHQEYPFPSLIEKINPHRDASYTPYSQYSFVFQQPREDVSLSQAWVPGKAGPKVNWAGLEVAQYPVHQQEGQFELEIEVVETHGQIFGIFKYKSDLFTQDKIEILAGHYIKILADGIKGADGSIAKLDILTDLERQQFAQWNQTERTYNEAKVLHRLIEAQVAKTPSQIAISYEDRNLSYAELNARSNQLAHYLLENGLQLENKVTVCMNRSIEMVVTLLAIMKAGGAYVPIDPNYPAARVAFLLEDTASPFLLTQAALVDSLPPTQSRCVLVDILDLNDYNDENLELDIQAHNLAYMIYTSGSTGQPKGAMNTHEAISNRLLWMQEAYQLTGDDVVFQKTPFSFDVSVWEFFWPLITGAKLCVAKPEGHKDTQYLIDTICQEKVTTLHFVPSMLSLFVADKNVSKCSSIRRFICSGEALSLDLQTRFFNKMECELHNLYGPTEAAIDVTHWQCRKDCPQPIVPIGKPISNIQIYILDKYMQQVPVGVSGELHIGGIGLARGYYKREALTAEKFVSNPFSDHPEARLYKTGDLARYLPDGNIEYLQRIDNQVKLRGFRIELGEVEAVLRQCDGIRDAVVIKKNGIHDDAYLVAYLTLDDRELKQEQVIAFAKQKLPEHSVPRAIVVLDEIPLTPNGKVNSKLMPEHSFDQDKKDNIVPPRSEAERQLLTLWRRVLGVEHISITDNFFDLGGHSLLAVQLMAEIEAQLTKKLPLSSLIQNPNIEALAELLEGSLDDEWNTLVPIQTQGEKTPMFFIPGGGGNVLYYYALAEHLGKGQPFFAIQAQGLDGKTAPNETVSAWTQSAVNAILSVQPDGPFIIGGHCVGGLIANEVAQILSARGKQVEQLIILDAPAPHFFAPKAMDLSYSNWICILVQAIAQMTGKTLDLDENRLEGQSESEQLEKLKEKLVQVKVVPANTPLSQIGGLLSVFIANTKLHYEAPAKQYPVPVTLLRAKEISEHYDYRLYDDENSSMETSTLGWSAYSCEKVKVVLVPGDHITMLSSENASKLAFCLKQGVCQGRSNWKIHYQPS